MRHGLTELNKLGVVNGQIDEPLAPEGIQQAHDSIILIPTSVTHIYTSSLQRARHTGEILNSKLNHPISSHDEIGEINMGSLAGKSWEQMESGSQLKKKHRSAQFDYRIYGGESSEEVIQRVVAFLTEINQKHSSGEALIVTHGGIIRILHSLHNGEPITGEVENLSLHTFDLDKILKNSF